MSRLPSTAPSHIELEVHHVAVLHDVVLALLAQLAGRTAPGLAAQLHVVGVGGRLGLDEQLILRLMLRKKKLPINQLLILKSPVLISKRRLKFLTLQKIQINKLKEKPQLKLLKQI